MRSRREILGWMSAGVATATMPDGAFAETEDIKDCCWYADRLAEAMREKHGGNWEIMFDKKAKYVLVSRV